MKKTIARFFIGSLLSASLFTACTADDLSADGTDLNSESRVEITDIAAGDLIGKWDMYSMTADVAVDFNADGISSEDLLEETQCFDPMYFSFDENGNITTNQANLYFEEDGSFTCKSKEYMAEYEVSVNQLVVTFTMDGHVITDTKTVTLFREDGEEYLHVSLEKYETQAYVNDPGTTVASEIERLDLVFRKQ